MLGFLVADTIWSFLAFMLGWFVFFSLALSSIGWMFNFVFMNRAWNVFRAIMRDVKDGKAYIVYSRRGPACHTESRVEFSGGIITTALNPVDSPFGIYKVKAKGLDQSLGLSKEDVRWLGKRIHKHMQSKYVNDGYGLEVN